MDVKRFLAKQAEEEDGWTDLAQDAGSKGKKTHWKNYKTPAGHAPAHNVVLKKSMHADHFIDHWKDLRAVWLHEVCKNR